MSLIGLTDSVYGSLIGGAIGDALGAPVEGWHVSDVRQRYGKVDRFMPQSEAAERAGGGAPGQVTDDSALRHYLCLAIGAKQGRIDPDDYAAVWLQRMNPQRFFYTERAVLEKLRMGMSPWDTGRGQPLANAALMSIAPIGLINVANPAQAYQDGYLLAGMHQDGVERDAAATLAATVAVAAQPDTDVTSLIETMLHYSSDHVRRLVLLALDLAEESGGPDDFADAFYDRMLDRFFPIPRDQTWDKDRWIGPTSQETLPAVVGLLHLTGQDPKRCISEGASIGRDADTIASILGCIVGALHGARALDSDWITECEAANAAFFAEADPSGQVDSFRSAADLVTGAIEAEREAAQRRHRSLAELTR